MSEKKHIFVIDDSEAELKKYEVFLKDIQHEVHYFSSPLKALEVMDEISPHLIVLDYLMPEMRGDEFMVRVSELLLHNHEWQVYLVTSKEFSTEESLSMMTLGITHIFDKPLKKEEFLDSINEFLG